MKWEIEIKRAREKGRERDVQNDRKKERHGRNSSTRKEGKKREAESWSGKLQIRVGNKSFWAFVVKARRRYSHAIFVAIMFSKILI